MSEPDARPPALHPGIIFVTGASRSGTTMLSRIFANHSTILGLNELHYFGDLCDVGRGRAPLSSAELSQMAAVTLARQARTIWGSGPTAEERSRAEAICATLPPEERNGFGLYAAVLAALCREAGKPTACEQTPRNIYYAQPLLAAFPQARLVHIVRDPRAVLASQKNRWKLRQHGAKNVPWSELIRTWVNYHPITATKLWVGASNCALHSRSNPRFRMVRFEELVAQPRPQVEALCGFLGIGFEPQMLEVNQWGSSNLKHELDKKGISQEVISQWERSLSAGELVISEYVSRDLMGRLNYSRRSQGSMRAFAALPHLLTYPAHLLGVALANPRRAWIQLKATLLSTARGRA